MYIIFRMDAEIRVIHSNPANKQESLTIESACEVIRQILNNFNQKGVCAINPGEMGESYAKAVGDCHEFIAYVAGVDTVKKIEACAIKDRSIIINVNVLNGFMSGSFILEDNLEARIIKKGFYLDELDSKIKSMN